MYMASAPSADSVISSLVLPVQERRDAEDAGRDQSDVGRAPHAVHRRERRRQVARSREPEDLPRARQDDAVERGEQAEEADGNQHVYPSALRPTTIAIASGSG